MKGLEMTKECSDDVAILKVLMQEYHSLIKIGLDTGKIEILKMKNSVLNVDETLFWEADKHRIFPWIYEEDQELIKTISLKELNAYYDEASALFPFEIRCLDKGKTQDWIKVNAKKLESEYRELLIMVQVTNESHMLQKIIDLYVVNNLDYFIVINVNDNSYLMYNGNPNSTIPPESGPDYEGGVKLYNAEFVVPEDLKETNKNMMIQHVLQKLESEAIYEFTAGFFDIEGHYHRSRLQFSYYDKDAGLIVLTRTDITQIYLEESEKERKLAKALREAKHDAMTELYNSKAVYELISDAVVHQYRANAVLFFIDLDNFKLVNDTLGHQVGDDVICHVAKKIKGLASKDGIAGRIGGDEFVLFLPITSTTEEIEAYAQAICNSIQDLAILQDKNLPVTCSVGISIYPKDGTTYDELLMKSDQALYDAKRFGKNCFSFYSSALEEYQKTSHGHI